MRFSEKCTHIFLKHIFFAYECQSKMRSLHVRARLKIRTGCLAYRKGAHNASETQPCCLDNAYKANIMHEFSCFKNMHISICRMLKKSNEDQHNLIDYI